MNEKLESPGIFHATDSGGYVECDRRFICEDEPEIIELIGCCGENETDKLLIHAESLPEAFFDLHSGLAGRILLKLTTYRIILAAVIPEEKIGRGKFYEMVLETNRGKDFRVFPTSINAVTWLSEIS